MAVDTLNVVPLPNIQVDRLMVEKPISEMTNDDWDATSIFFTLDPENDTVVGINNSIWQVFGAPPTLSLLLVSLDDSLEAAGFFRELPGVAVPDVPTGVRAQVQPITETGDLLKSVTEDQFIFRTVSLLVGRLGFSQPDLEEAIAKVLQSGS